MSFTLALLIVVALGATGLGLICVHLLDRLELHPDVVRVARAYLERGGYVVL